MRLLFAGTRGEIDLRTPEHQRHTCLLLSWRGKRVLIDCGLDWLDHLDELEPHAIVLTHAHPDHAWGLKNGAPCPVYASSVTWNLLADYPIPSRLRKTLEPGQQQKIAGLSFHSFAVEHSTRCPAVCYRVTAGKASMLYAPDVVFIPEHQAALAGCQLYIGDGASLVRPLVRKSGTSLVGHAAVRTQLGWCQKADVPWAIITHCGSQIVGEDQDKVAQQIAQWGKDRGMKAELAYDGLEVTLS